MNGKSDYRLRKFDGQEVLIAVGEKSKDDKRIIKLNDSAREIWELLESEKNEEAVADILCKKYGIDKNDALKDVKSVVFAMNSQENGVNIEDAIKEKGYAVSTPSGNSMHPMLESRRDTVIIKPISNPLNKYDVILYKRKQTYILHRIIKVTGDGYIIRGDNCYYTETDIKDENIIGKMTEFYRKDKHYYENDFIYKVYSVIRVNTFWLRMLFVYIRRILSKIKHLIIK